MSFDEDMSSFDEDMSSLDEDASSLDEDTQRKRFFKSSVDHSVLWFQGMLFMFFTKHVYKGIDNNASYAHLGR